MHKEYRYKISIRESLKALSGILWTIIIAFIIYIVLSLNSYQDRYEVDYLKIGLIILLVFSIMYWGPIFTFYINYTLYSFGRTVTIDPRMKTVSQSYRGIELKIPFNEISSIKYILHNSKEKVINDPSSFWDKFENYINSYMTRVPWSKFSYLQVKGSNNDRILVTSIMTSFDLIPFENYEIEYVRFPFIKNRA